MLIFFDLEGPLSPQDNAYEVLSLVENGRKIFEIISRYDDVLTLESRHNYEPGDTLKLIVPFLIYHNISEEDIKKVSHKARVVKGARGVISELRKEGWKVRIISTSYEQHAFNIGRKVGVAKEDIACTRLPLSKYASELKNADFQIIRKLEEIILDEKDEQKIVKILDDFFFNELQKTPLGRVFSEVAVVGGQRKVEAMQRFVESEGADFREVVAVGDSITDYKMLKKVKESAGLAIVFNGNEFAVPYASVGVASTTLRSILPITSAFLKGGKDNAVEAARRLEKSGNYSCLESADKKKLEQVINTHKRYRMLVRGQAGKLG
ncbi:MAG: HAD family hydrolase [Methanobacteriota archaeon]